MVRAILIFLSIALQIGIFLLASVIFSDIFIAFEIFMLILSIIIVIGIIAKNKNPGNKMLWIILILAFPVLGVSLYLIIGHNIYKSKRLKALYFSMSKIKEYLIQDDNILDEIKQKDRNIFGDVNYIVNKAGFPIYKEDMLSYYSTGEEVYPEIIKELNNAKHYIFMEYFTISDGKMWEEILDILERKVKDGVDVRVIYDDIGSAAYLPKDFRKNLKQKGIRCVCFNELKPIVSAILNNRDHRKITVIDSKVAFCGGINIADEYINKKKRFGYWKDCAIKVEGKAALSFTAIFLEIWNVYSIKEQELEEFKYEDVNFSENLKSGYICPYAESPLDSENLGENIYLNIINRANDYVYIFTPYLIPDSDLLTSLTLAAKRGVDVRIVLPSIPDKKIVYSISKSYYKILMKSGIKIYEYTPGFIHSKVFVCDDKVATVGTFNLDYRSLYTHFECGTYIYNSKVINDIKDDALNTFKESHLVIDSDLKRSIFRNLINAVLRLFAPLV